MATKMVDFQGKHENVYDFLDVFAKSSSALMLDFLYELNEQLTRKLRMDVLKGILRARIEGEQEALISKKQREKKLSLIEHNRFERIKYFEYMSETQLENELIALKQDKKHYLYLKTLWEKVLNVVIDRGALTASLSELLEKAHAANEVKLDIKTYNRDTDIYFKDEPNHLDGIPKHEFKRIMQATASLNELSEIGAKFEIQIPPALNKDAYKANIMQALKKAGHEPLMQTLNEQKTTLKQLDEINKKQSLNLSRHMTKNGAIDHLLRHQKDDKADKDNQPKAKPLSLQRVAAIDELTVKTDELTKKLNVLSATNKQFKKELKSMQDKQILLEKSLKKHRRLSVFIMMVLLLVLLLLLLEILPNAVFDLTSFLIMV